jgi:hypothetical protein
MTKQDTPDSHDNDVAPLWGSQAPVVRFETLVPFTAPVGLLDGGVNLDPPRWQKSSPEEVLPDTHCRCKSRQNRTGTSAARIRRELAQIWHLMLALRIDEAVRMIEQLEPRFDDGPPKDARRLRAATQLLRAVGLAYRDDSLAVFPIAVSLLKKGGTTNDNHAALTLCRLGLWRSVSLIASVCYLGANRAHGGQGRCQCPRCLT